MLMPLRHTPTVDRLRSLMERIEGMTDTHEQHGLLLDKFRRQTLRRLQVRAFPRQSCSSPGHYAVSCVRSCSFSRCADQRARDPQTVQDLEGKQWTDGQEILEFHPFQADETMMLKHPLARYVFNTPQGQIKAHELHYRRRSLRRARPAAPMHGDATGQT